MWILLPWYRSAPVDSKGTQLRSIDYMHTPPHLSVDNHTPLCDPWLFLANHRSRLGTASWVIFLHTPLQLCSYCLQNSIFTIKLPVPTRKCINHRKGLTLVPRWTRELFFLIALIDWCLITHVKGYVPTKRQDIHSSHQTIKYCLISSKNFAAKGCK